MKKDLFGILVIAVLILPSCATTSGGNSDTAIVGQWLMVGNIDRKTGIVDYDSYREGRPADAGQFYYEFLTNGEVRMFSERKGEEMNFEINPGQTNFFYRVVGNKIYFAGNRQNLRLNISENRPFGEFYLSGTNVLTIYLYNWLSLEDRISGKYYLEDRGFVYNKFEVQIEEFRTLAQADSIETALENAAKVIMVSLPKGRNIAISNVSAEDKDQSDFIANELEFILIKAGFVVIERSQLDVIRKEQNLQLSGDVDDNEIISIGKFSGANVLITGSIDGSGLTRRLRLRLLDVETARVITAASERF